jgi:hypothetical protein
VYLLKFYGARVQKIMWVEKSDVTEKDSKEQWKEICKGASCTGLRLILTVLQPKNTPIVPSYIETG